MEFRHMLFLAVITFLGVVWWIVHEPDDSQD